MAYVTNLEVKPVPTFSIRSHLKYGQSHLFVSFPKIIPYKRAISLNNYSAANELRHESIFELLVIILSSYLEKEGVC